MSVINIPHKILEVIKNLTKNRNSMRAPTNEDSSDSDVMIRECSHADEIRRKELERISSRENSDSEQSVCSDPEVEIQNKRRRRRHRRTKRFLKRSRAESRILFLNNRHFILGIRPTPAKRMQQAQIDIELAELYAKVMLITDQLNKPH